MIETQARSVHTAIFVEKCVMLRLTNALGDEDKNRHIINYSGKHEKDITFSKEIWLEKADACSFSEGDEISLMDWSTAIIDGVEKDKDGNVTMLSGYLNGGDPLKSTTKYPMLWLPVTDKLVHLSLVKFDHPDHKGEGWKLKRISLMCSIPVQRRRGVPLEIPTCVI
ncbi:hypothetical protein AQUCO_02900015v1 [Aquilegia coerulea]|uniref:Glutamyl/glutaminyl-tRNA synthetase class Ib anti-codon binding domain-containing protein n=1 Tax=Aquilegia coerulea TaxID=218851 RepID=A0A2G5D2Y9_AQUCA|nr:hypothetical protein AQUCO_02900015v1 [Aquilegia coerulea]